MLRSRSAALQPVSCRNGSGISTPDRSRMWRPTSWLRRNAEVGSVSLVTSSTRPPHFLRRSLSALCQLHSAQMVTSAFSSSNSIMRAVARLGAERFPIYGRGAYQSSRIDGFRGGGDGAGAGRAQRATGSSTTIANSAAPTVVQRQRQHCPLPSRARARRRRFQRARRQTDLHRPARRRCGCWPTSTVLFRGIGVGSFGGGRWRSRRSAPMLDVGFARVGAAAMVPAPVERSELPGHRQRSQIPQHRQ